MATANASRSVSPGAALLRSSRMFSMPAPIPAARDLSLATKHKSATATTPYPTRLSVTTSSDSRIVGDWGFKRPLPAKTTNKSTLPLVRVKQMDSIEHVTDFQSSSDHTITLYKWQEMSMDISTPRHRDDRRGLKSAFEEAGDVTALTSEQRVQTETTRWKFQGPWLAGMTDGEFNGYLTSKVRGKRAEFRQFLKSQFASEISENRRQEAASKAEEAPAALTASDITDEVFMDCLRKLRGDRVHLYRLVSRFLDLAPLSNETKLDRLGNMKPYTAYTFYSDSPYASSGPPITHPSAGLSYLRTKNYLDNHPLYGPQQYHPPVQARIVTPRNNAAGYVAKIGVAGIIGRIPEGETSFNVRENALSNRPFIPGLNDYLPNVAGGSKVYVQPESAWIGPDGKIMLNFDETNAQAEVVQKELVGESDVFDKAAKEKLEPTYRVDRSRLHRKRPRRILGSSQSYGLESLAVPPTQ
ncbi:mitochondrial ribosomal protein MRP51 [Xylariales sp. PMI_506]|nr:mitochondrial ribosomal protein MRP51 [Xylariales sp. PMI_506]